MELKFLTDEEADEILASTRTRGAYKAWMSAFLESGAKGANASAAFPKVKVASVYQGLNSVKKDQKLDDISIRKHEDTIFVIRLAAGESDDE